MVRDETQKLNVNKTDMSYVVVDKRKGRNITYNKFRPIASLKQAPLFKFTDRDLHESDYHHSLLMSMPVFANYLELNSVQDLQYGIIMINLKPGPKSIEDNLFMDIKNALPAGFYQKGIFESRHRPHIERMDAIVTALFQFVILITLFLMFFSLNTTMTSNIYEQAKEIGCLRSLGLTKPRVVWLYVYESYILVVASSILGTMIGVTIGYTMSL